MNNETIMNTEERKIAETWPSKAMLQLVSVGRLCEVTQSTLTRVVSAAVQADVVPTMYLDGVPFFTEDSAEKIMVYIANSRAGQSETKPELRN